jgi:DNA-binding CsgD family transcriptional regulator
MTPTAPHAMSASASATAATTANSATTASDQQVLTAVAEILDDSRWRAHLDRVATLSRRELDILIQLGSGASNSTIVRRLGITEHTVKAHIGRILAKLRLESRLQAGLVGYLWALSAQPAR